MDIGKSVLIKKMKTMYNYINPSQPCFWFMSELSPMYRGFPLTSLITLAMPRCAMLGGRLDWGAVIYLLTCLIFHGFEHILHT